MILLSHPTGNRNVRAVLAALAERGLLTTFHGTIAISREATWTKWLPGRLRAEMERRRYDLPRGQVCAHPGRELARHVALRLGAKSWTRHEKGWACVDRVYRSLDRMVARGLDAAAAVRAVYAFEDGADATFTRAEALGGKRIYDLPIAYWECLRNLMQEEGARLPNWAGTLGGGLSDSQEKLDRKTRELELAELVVTPSRFVADSLPKWAAGKRVIVSPFGSPPPLDPQVFALKFQLSAQRAAAGAPLRVLFAGSMGQRKGLGDLMTAVRSLARRDVELVVMGSLQADRGFYERECPGYIHEGGRPHAQVLELMRSCDVFCLPSIVEGRALVMQEAMSQGLPLIITPNTGGEDLVEPEGERPETGDLKPEDGDQSAEGGGARQAAQKRNELNSESSGKAGHHSYHPCRSLPASALRSQPSDLRFSAPAAASNPQVSGFTFQVSAEPTYGRSATGFLVPIRSPQAIAEAIAWFADHRLETIVMGRAAAARAALYSWEDYGDRIVAAIRDLVKP